MKPVSPIKKIKRPSNPATSMDSVKDYMKKLGYNEKSAVLI